MPRPSGRGEEIMLNIWLQPHKDGGDMPFVRVWIHLIWSTKNREKIISKELKPKLLEHIKNNSKLKSIWLDSINCVQDHIHLMISIGAEQNISKIVMLLKGESSHRINKYQLTQVKFEWQEEYITLSVSESAVNSVREYILNQEGHHKIKSFKEEYDEFLENYGVNSVN